MNKVPKISIIYVNYNSRWDLEKAIKSVIDSNPKTKFEVIVVDNSPRDIISVILRKILPNIKYIKSARNLGYGAGNNLGASVARGEYLLILNPDTFVKKGVVDVLANFLDRHKNTAIIAPNLLDSRGIPFEKMGSRTLTPLRAIFALSFINKLLPNNPISRKYFLRDEPTNKLREVGVVPGSAFMIRKNVFNEIGSFDEKVFMFFEESDLGKRIKDAGYKIFIEPNAEVVHKQSIDKPNSDELQKIFNQSRFYYFRKHFGFLKAVTVDIFLKVNIEVVLFSLFVAIAFFLRFYSIENSYPWGGEQGENYLELKKYFENGQIPLKGPLTGRSWLQLQPLYYWIMTPLFIIFRWDPIIPAYFFGLFSMTVAVINYFFVKKWFNDFVAKTSTLLVLISPFWLRVVKGARFYFLSLLFSYFYFYFLISAVKEKNKRHIYFSILCLFTMLHFHYVALVFIPSFLFILYKHRESLKINWIKGLVMAFIPSIPFFIVNIRENFNPLFKMTIWIPYRIIGFFGLIDKNNFSISVFLSNINALLQFYGWQIYIGRNFIMTLVSILFIFYTLFFFFKGIEDKNKIAQNILIFSFIILYLSLFVHGSPPNHYFINVMFVPPIVIAHFIYSLSKRLPILNKKILLFFTPTLVLILSSKAYFCDYIKKPACQNKNESISYGLQKQISSKIIANTQGVPFTLERVGEFDYYEGDFAQNYKYLLWWMGNEPVDDARCSVTIIEDGLGTSEINDDTEQVNGVTINYNCDL